MRRAATVYGLQVAVPDASVVHEEHVNCWNVPPRQIRNCIAVEQNPTLLSKTDGQAEPAAAPEKSQTMVEENNDSGPHFFGPTHSKLFHVLPSHVRSFVPSQKLPSEAVQAVPSFGVQTMTWLPSRMSPVRCSHFEHSLRTHFPPTQESCDTPSEPQTALPSSVRGHGSPTALARQSHPRLEPITWHPFGPGQAKR